MGPRDVARATGVSTDTLRHYERKGLLPGSHAELAGNSRGKRAHLLETLGTRPVNLETLGASVRLGPQSLCDCS